MKHGLLLFLLLIAPLPAVAQEPLSPILRTELEKESAIPGQPIVLRVTLLVPTWMPKPPVFPSFETADVIVRLPPRASGPVSERVGGETWSGVTRAYRLYPMTLGRFRIAPLPVTVTFADPETRQSRSLELRSAELVFEGVAPVGAEGLDPFIAAEALTLEQTLEGDPANLEPGEAFTRKVTARIEGTSAIFLPPLIAPLAGAIAAYPKEPLVTETTARGVLSGERLESVTYVAEAGGRFTAPPVRLRWFNLSSGRVEAAELPGIEILSRGPAPSRAFDWRGAAGWIIGAALLAVLLGGAAMRFRPPIAAWYRRRQEARAASEAFAFARALEALQTRDIGQTLRALDLWSIRLPRDCGPEDARLSGALARLGAARYSKGAAGPPSGLWSEATRALRAARRERLATIAEARAPLPPLNPRSAS